MDPVTRVFEGLKPWGQAHIFDKDIYIKYQQISQSLKDKFRVIFKEKDWNRSHMYIITAYPKNTSLRKFFGKGNLEILMQDYINAGLKNEAFYIKNVMHKTFGNLGDVTSNCPTSVTGLVLGYPIENSICLCRNEFRGFDSNEDNSDSSSAINEDDSNSDN